MLCSNFTECLDKAPVGVNMLIEESFVIRPVDKDKVGFPLNVRTSYWSVLTTIRPYVSARLST